ncbi:helix-turn-helix domain-containing protein [Virgibacillus ainsalahensis]
MNKRDKLIRNIENHLRLTARQLLKFDTEEEVLRYLADSFQSRFECDFVGVIIQEGDSISPKMWSGGLDVLRRGFPIKVDDCTPSLFQQSVKFDDDHLDETCEFINLVNNEDIKTWFTVPIQDEQRTYGFCAIGYLDFIPLLELDETFDEFGKDIALALSLTKQKEQEQKKMMGIEFISQNLSLNESIENLVEKIVNQAGKGTNATFAGIYLYDEEQNHFKFQPPSYGSFWRPEKIFVQKNYVLKEYFPYLEAPGGKELTVPLMMDVQTVGVLHVEKKQTGIFTYEDLEMLTVMAEHVSSLLRNAYLYKNERDQMKRLHSLLDYQQILIKKTINEDDFNGITTVVSDMFQKPVLLMDRFLHPISYKSFPVENIELILEEIKVQMEKVKDTSDYSLISLHIDGKVREFFICPVNGGRDLVGYFIVENDENELEAFDQLAVDLIRNIYSVQFIKQKLVLDTKSQVKDNFVDMLLVEEIEEVDMIMQYANIFQWNVFGSHRVAVLSIKLDEVELRSNDILEQQAKKSTVFDQLKSKISNYDPNIMFAKKGEVYILIAPEGKEIPNEKKYWNQLVRNIQKWLLEGEVACYGMLGIGGKTNKLEDYYKCYKQALQTLNVVIHQQIAEHYAFFEDLGSYTLLHLIKDTAEAHYFMQNYLEKLMDHSKGNNINLFKTLRVYLEQNGSIKKTSDALFIHRSTLLYRIEKIKEILEVDMDDSDIRFNLMMTYKLFDLQHNEKEGHR